MDHHSTHVFFLQSNRELQCYFTRRADLWSSMKYSWHWQGHTVLSNIGLVWQGFVSLMLSDDYFFSISLSSTKGLCNSMWFVVASIL